MSIESTLLSRRAIHTGGLVLISYLLLSCSPALGQDAAQTDSPAQCVVLLHGLGRTAFSMGALEDTLKSAGFFVVNNSYDSLSKDIWSLATSAVGDGIEQCKSRNATTIHFITHSLGGILVRQYFQATALSELGRIVMLSPPNQGSEVIDMLGGFAAVLGPAGERLGTDATSIPLQLEPIDGEIGVITGNQSSDPWFSPGLPGPDDGKVTVESAKLKEMADFLVVPTGHTFILRDDAVIQQSLHFLQHGRFQHGDSTAEPSE